MIFSKTTSCCTLLVFCFVFSFTISCDSDINFNIALHATVSTSFVSSWESLWAVKDGIDPENSADDSNGAYGNWAGEFNFNTYNYVQYSWASSKDIVLTKVYWWNDGLGIEQPTDAYIQYLDEDTDTWVDAGKIRKVLDRYNYKQLKVTTTSLRIYMKSNKATGILEWKVYGSGAD